MGGICQKPFVRFRINIPKNYLGNGMQYVLKGSDNKMESVESVEYSFLGVWPPMRDPKARTSGYRWGDREGMRIR